MAYLFQEFYCIRCIAILMNELTQYNFSGLKEVIQKEIGERTKVNSHVII